MAEPSVKLLRRMEDYAECIRHENRVLEPEYGDRMDRSKI